MKPPPDQSFPEDYQPSKAERQRAKWAKHKASKPRRIKPRMESPEERKARQFAAACADAKRRNVLSVELTATLTIQGFEAGKLTREQFEEIANHPDMAAQRARLQDALKSPNPEP